MRGRESHLYRPVRFHDCGADRKSRCASAGRVDRDEHVLHVLAVVAVVPKDDLGDACLKCGNVVVPEKKSEAFVCVRKRMLNNI
jgi:hypothetical protein